MAAFCWVLVEGIYSFLFLVKVYNINTKIHMYHFISWGIFISLVINYCKLLNRNRFKNGRMNSRVALTSFYLCLGLPIILVSISISIAAGKDGIKSYISETQYEKQSIIQLQFLLSHPLSLFYLNNQRFTTHCCC